MIPQEKSEAVRRGLLEAFGVADYDDIAKVTGGHTNSLVSRVVVRGTPYLLKIIVRAEDPTRHYTSMKAAAEAGLAPRVWYANSEDKVAITDFVKTERLPISEALTRLPAMLRTLHALPPFGRAPFNTTCTFLFNPGTIMAGFVDRFRAAQALSPADYDEFFARYAELAEVYPKDEADFAACHNDLFKPDNILFDGDRAWLVDWEAAFLNDRYADLAVVGYQVASNEADEAKYLETYFGGPPTAYQRARYHLMQQTAHLFYTMSMLTQGGMGKPVDWAGGVDDFDEYHRRVWAEGIDLSDAGVKVAYGKMHWHRLLRNARQDRYRESLKIAGQR